MALTEMEVKVRIKTIRRMYKAGHTWAEIGDSLGCSRDAVRRFARNYMPEFKGRTPKAERYRKEKDLAPSKPMPPEVRFPSYKNPRN